MIYFQGTDNTLWQMGPNGQNPAKVHGFQCKSSPFAYGKAIYFQGTDDKLWAVNLDGSGSVVLGNNTCASAPFVAATGVYFQGTDDKLWRWSLVGETLISLGGNTCKSTPYVLGQYVFFQGTDDALWRINIDGTNLVHIGSGFQTSSSPFATPHFLFFRGTDDKVWRTDLDGANGLNLGGGYKCSSTPCASDTSVYFRGTDDALWKTDLAGNGGRKLSGWKCKSSPVFDPDQNCLFFQGIDDALWRTDTDGNHGVHLANYKTASPVFAAEPSNQPVAGDVPIPYVVLLLAYSPPGSSTGAGASQIEYSSGSTAGTSLSYSHSVNEGWGLTASLTGPQTSSGGGKMGGDSGQGSSAIGNFDLGYSRSGTNTTKASLDVKKTQSSSITIVGPSTDGINHDLDLIFLLLRPSYSVILDPKFNMNWNLDFAGPNQGVVWLQMDWLKNLDLFAQAEPSVKSRCDAAGLTPADYKQLLALNPFAYGPAPIDTQRYISTGIQAYYQPAGSEGQAPTQSYPFSYSVNNANESSVETSWTITGSLSGSLTFGALMAALKGNLSLTSTDTAVTNNSFEEDQSATATITAPAAGYQADTYLRVYWDTIFSTFMFVLSDAEPPITGVIHDVTGKPLPNTEVQLVVAGQVFYTWSDSTGTYRFYDIPSGEAVVTIVKRKHRWPPPRPI
ncbi:hypothetical protein JAO29_09035 [Edaphobacter sp. HDX4]|uniref:DUF5050 domain-containing protein n=1 Tax=Edaphobacter sp. HDX4 TaxID=2794064 RepID=UPI002FE69EDF